MNRKSVALSYAIILLLCFGSFFLYLEHLSSKRAWETERSARQGLEEQLAQLQADLEEARGLLASERDALALLRGAHKALADAAAAKEEEATSSVVEEKTAEKTRRALSMISSPDEADDLVKELFRRGDLRGLMLLASDLLALGEEGHEKLYALSTLLDDKRLKDAFDLFGQEEVVIGTFLRAIADSHEDILRFGLFLDSKNPEEMPEFMKDFHRQLREREIGPILLGYYQGDDPEILGAYTEMYSQELESNLANNQLRDDHLWGLAQIPTPEAAAVLIDVFPRAPAKVQGDVLRALTWQGTENALPTLRALRQNTSDPKVLQLIDAAIRYLQ